MNSWFDVTGISKVTELRSDQEGIEASVEHIQSIIQAEIDAGVPRCSKATAGPSSADSHLPK